MAVGSTACMKSRYKAGCRPADGKQSVRGGGFGTTAPVPIHLEFAGRSTAAGRRDEAALQDGVATKEGARRPAPLEGLPGGAAPGGCT